MSFLFFMPTPTVLIPKLPVSKHIENKIYYHLILNLNSNKYRSILDTINYDAKITGSESLGVGPTS